MQQQRDGLSIVTKIATLWLLWDSCFRHPHYQRASKEPYQTAVILILCMRTLKEENIFRGETGSSER